MAAKDKDLWLPKLKKKEWTNILVSLATRRAVEYFYLARIDTNFFLGGEGEACAPLAPQFCSQCT